MPSVFLRCKIFLFLHHVKPLLCLHHHSYWPSEALYFQPVCLSVRACVPWRGCAAEVVHTCITTYTHTHTHPFNGPFSGTTQVSRYQIGETHLDFIEARDSECRWHQLGHMQVCTLLQTDNHASKPPLSFYRPDALPATQPTVSKH